MNMLKLCEQITENILLLIADRKLTDLAEQTIELCDQLNFTIMENNGSGEPSTMLFGNFISASQLESIARRVLIQMSVND